MKPDPASTLDTTGMDEKTARAGRKSERVKAWKRESKKSDRTKAQKERIAEWEKATGLMWEEVSRDALSGVPGRGRG